MDWVLTIAGWCCVAIVALAAGVYLIVGLAMVGDRIHRVLRRRKFREFTAVRIERGQAIVTDAELAAKLSALGEYAVSVSEGVVDFHWTKPTGLLAGFAPLDVGFSISPDNIGPDAITFALWQRFVSDQQQHWAAFESALLQAYRFNDFDETENGAKLSDERILAQVRSVTIHIDQEGMGEEGLHDMSASFDIEWDEEHGFALGFNPSTVQFDFEL
jgi:hypothetical protein